MSGARYQPYGRFNVNFPRLEAGFREGIDLPERLLDHNRSDWSQDSADLIRHLQNQRARMLEANARVALVYELGFVLAPQDMPAAAVSMLSFVMHGDGNGQGGELVDAEGMDQDMVLDMDEAEGGEETAEVDNEGEEGEDEPRRQRKPRKPRRPYTITCALRQTNWFESSLEWEDEHFRAMYRMSKPTFWEVERIIRGNPIFNSGRGTKCQRPVHYQLGVFLLRYGVVGSHAHYPKLLASIGEGSVVNYCRRVIRAIREHGVDCVVWPTEERKVEIKRGFKKICGLDNIVGSLDGTLCGLETKPRVAGDSYISRKKTFSVNVQAIVDHTGHFLAFQSGWPGSRPDRAVWPHMWVNEQRHELFSKGEFLLADGGYSLTQHVLIPFSRNELDEDRRRREFNRKISRARIVVEWAFGRLKARFPSLKRMGAAKDIGNIYRAIEAMMVLHNMCHQLGDTPPDCRVEPAHDDPWDSSDEDLENGELEDDIAGGPMRALDLGRTLRERYVDILCPR